MDGSTIANSSLSVMGTLKDVIKITGIKINNSASSISIIPKEEINISVTYECVSLIKDFRVSFTILKDGVSVLTIHDLIECKPIEPGLYESQVVLPKYLLRPGEYMLSVGGHNTNHTNYSVGNVEWLYAPDVFSFEILEEWEDNYDFNNKGLINLKNANGERKFIKG
jgi:hypothetical protein